MQDSDKPGDSEKLPRGYVIAFVLAAIIIIIPLFVSWYKHPDQIEEQLSYFFPILGLIILFIADQRNLLRQQMQWRQQVLQQVRDLDQGRTKLADHFTKLEDGVMQQCARAILNAAVIIPYSVRDAHRHVATNAKRAEQIHNTRLARHRDETGAIGYMDARDMQDQGFRDAVVAGTVYHLIYDATQQQTVDKFIDEVKKLDHRGQIYVHAVDVQDIPLVQFIVLDYGNGNMECLLGYGVGDQIGSTQQIFLIRSAALCTYLVQVFDVYRRLLTAKPGDHHGPDDVVSPSI